MFPSKEETSKKIDNESKTFLGSNALFKGELAFQGTMCIDGKFEGQLRTKDTLIIGENGEVLADIEAGTLICKGTIKGNIKASQKVELTSTSKVIGDVQTLALSAELGAIFEGKFNVSGEPSPSENKSKSNSNLITLK